MSKEVKITLTIDGIEREVKNVEELQSELKGLNKETKKAADSQGFFSKKSKELKERLDGFKDTLKEVGTGFKNGFKNLKTFVGGFKTAGGAVKNFGVLAKGAIAATGIGLLVVAVVSLIDYFRNLEGGAKALKKVMAGLGSIVTNISQAFSLVVKGEFKEAFNLLKDGVVEATEAIDDQFAAEKRLSELRQQTIIQNANLRQEIEKYKKILEDTTLTTEQRLAALNKITEATKQLALNQKQETEEALAAAEAELLTIDNFEQRRQKQEEIAQLQADLIDQTTALQTIEYDAAKVAREIRQQELDDKRRITEEEKKLADEEFAKFEEIYNKKKALMEKEQKARMDAILARAKAEKDAANQTNKTEELIAQTKIDVTQDALSAIIAIAGEQSVLGKAAAVSQATINTYQAATNALANTPAPPPFPQIAAGAVVAQGLASVRNILKTSTPGGTGGGGSVPNIPRPQIVDPTQAAAGFAGGTAGATQTFAQSGTTGTIKAYVVAEEMTSTQEANKRIDDLARL